MGYAIYKDITKLYEEEWTNHGRRVLEESCKHKNGIEENGYCEKCDISEEKAEPMINYIYPLELDSFDDKKILKVVNETNCTVLEDPDGNWYLCLCGGGMDLTQDIALAYIILETWIPKDLLAKVCKQPMLSTSKKQYKILAKQMIRQLRIDIGYDKMNIKEWRENLKKVRKKEE